MLQLKLTEIRLGGSAAVHLRNVELVVAVYLKHVKDSIALLYVVDPSLPYKKALDIVFCFEAELSKGRRRNLGN